MDSLQYPNGESLLKMHEDMQNADGGSKTALLKQLSDEWLKIGQPSISADYLRQRFYKNIRKKVKGIK